MPTSTLEPKHAKNDAPVVPQGKMAVSIAMWPWRTRVKARFSASEGIPKCWFTVLGHKFGYTQIEVLPGSE